jgi:hypothetical protein
MAEDLNDVRPHWAELERDVVESKGSEVTSADTDH